MAFLDNNNVVLKGISAAVPKHTVDIHDIYCPEWGNVEDFISSTTIERLHLSLPEQTASDLCIEAANALISELKWEKESIEALIFVSQTPDYYFVPATACHLQSRLGLSNKCLAFDITLGCSGWVYGLSVLSSMINNGKIKRALLLSGDTCSKIVRRNDASMAPLFGDAGSATAIEFSENETGGIKSALFTDGEGYDAIICKQGAFRYPALNQEGSTDSGSTYLSNHAFYSEMDGMSVFSFAISQAPKSINSLIEHFNVKKESIDILALHQANLLINNKITNKVKLSNARVPQSLKDFGNTSCASIPLTLVTEEAESLRSSRQNIIACGYGVGLSWGAVAFSSDHIVVPPLIEV